MDTPSGSTPRSMLHRIARGIGVVELTLGGIALMMIFALVLMQALQRYLPIESVAWAGELARFSLIWLTFSAMGLLVTSRGHIALEIMDALPNPMAVRLIQVFALVIVAAAGFGLVLEALNLVSTQHIVRSPVLRMPMSWVYLPVLVGAVSTTIRASIAAVDVAVHGPVLTETEEDIADSREGLA